MSTSAAPRATPAGRATTTTSWRRSCTGSTLPSRVKALRLHVAAGRLFDVGAAAGFFMDEARRAGWDVHGADISPTMSAYGRDRLGLDLRTATFDAVDVTGPFDCVTMWDYIEHATDPLGDLRHAHDLLRGGGILALSTGDVRSLVGRASGSRWHLLTPRHHNFFFAAANLRLACERAGFEVLSVRHPATATACATSPTSCARCCPRARSCVASATRSRRAALGVWRCR